MKITILTEKTPENKTELIQKYFTKVKIFLATRKYKKYTGHYAVTRSLIEGLKKINFNYNYNPNNVNNISENVIVLSGIKPLKQAIKLKKEGKIKKLLAGPNIVTFPFDYNNIITSSEIDICIVPSEWVKSFYIKLAPILKQKIKIWYAGIDEKYWNCKNTPFFKKILLYNKQDNKNFKKEVCKIIKKYNWSIDTIEYGKYSKKELKKKLSDVSFVVFLSNSESQGISLAETWSVNKPTLVWDPHFLKINNLTLASSSAPYLTKATGLKWENLQELEKILQTIQKELKNFSPRNWILENMTDKISSLKMIELIKQNKK